MYLMDTFRSPLDSLLIFELRFAQLRQPEHEQEYKILIYLLEKSES